MTNETSLASLDGPDDGDQAQQLEDVQLDAKAALTDSELARKAIKGILKGRFLFVRGLDWMKWDGQRWARDAEADARHAVDLYLRNVVADEISGGADLKALLSILSKSTVRNVTSMAADNPEIRRDAADFDAVPDLLNTPAGIVNLRTGDVAEHDPKYLMTKITRGSYRPGYRHPDWEKALEALPAPERTWFQSRIGQGITGERTPDGVMPVLQGGGENGKTLLTTDGLVLALGDYADVASSKLVAADRPGRSEHSTERADLRGQRLLIGEELSEGQSLDVTALKQIMDVGHIRARYTHQDNITFTTSHSLFVTTNYVPVVTKTDHGTWRRLALLRFPYSFRKTADECVRDADRVGDPTLKGRIKDGADGQLDAIVTWAVEGAMRWYADPGKALLPTARIAADTLEWRKTADRILGFWTECLIADPGTGGGPPSCIMAEEMTEAFNVWLKGNGHNAWPKETFAPRFAEHQETTRHGVASARPKTAVNISRMPLDEQFSPLKTAPKRPTVWTRVRFRTADDQHEDEGGTEGTEVTPIISMHIGTKEFGSTSVPSVPLPSERPSEGPGSAPSATAATTADDIRSVAAAQVVAPPCTICHTTIRPGLAAAGWTTHPGCDPDDAASAA